MLTCIPPILRNGCFRSGCCPLNNPCSEVGSGKYKPTVLHEKSLALPGHTRKLTLHVYLVYISFQNLINAFQPEESIPRTNRCPLLIITPHPKRITMIYRVASVGLREPIANACGGFLSRLALAGNLIRELDSDIITSSFVFSKNFVCHRLPNLGTWRKPRESF